MRLAFFDIEQGVAGGAANIGVRIVEQATQGRLCAGCRAAEAAQQFGGQAAVGGIGVVQRSNDGRDGRAGVGADAFDSAQHLGPLSGVRCGESMLELRQGSASRDPKALQGPGRCDIHVVIPVAQKLRQAGHHPVRLIGADLAQRPGCRPANKKILNL